MSESHNDDDDGKKTPSEHEAREGASETTTSTRQTDEPEPAKGEHGRDKQAEATNESFGERFKHLWASQATTNWLITVFTGLLALLTFLQLEPQVIVQATPLQDFHEVGRPREAIVFHNVGNQAAYAMTNGIAMYIFEYPLDRKRLTSLPTNSIPFDLYPTAQINRPIMFEVPISNVDFADVSAGTHRLIYVWGTVIYRDWFGLPHGQNFCFAFGGSDISQAGLCAVSPPRYAYGMETDQEPNALPVP